MLERRLGRVVGLAVALAAATALADVKLPAVVGSNMVLQRGIKARIWGTAEPGEKVTVAVGKQSPSATADAQGKWAVVLEPMEAGGPIEITITGKNTIKLTNVLVGDVWVCSGQSNMAMTVSRSANAAQEAAAAKLPQIRLFKVRNVTSDKPLDDTEGQWAECAPANAPGFSAVGFFFGRKLHQDLKVPIGLINTSWGGTPAEAWTSLPTLQAAAELKPILDRWDTLVAQEPELMKKFPERLAKWKEAVEKAKAAKKRPPRRPRPPAHSKSPHRPANLYNGMIAPIIPFAIKGAIWYQGESNAGRAYQYRTLFPTMIKDWRKNWAQGDFSFFWVQLANFRGVDRDAVESNWAELREAQTMTLALPNTGEAVIIDIGEARDIHPKNKQDVGKRLALAAESVAYAQKLVFSGPRYDKMAVEGAKARIHFTHVGGGLAAPAFTDPVTPCGPTLAKRFGLEITPELRPKADVMGFAIAGADKKFVWANAKIDGKTVVVWSDQVAKPVAVRYAWSNNPICNLYNAEGLPACPFRTDQWPGTTVNNK